MSQAAEIKGLDELLKKMQAYPTELVKVMAVGMSASLNIFWENVPPYPPPPQNSTYRRTGGLGRSLGSDEGGGASGNPSVYRIRRLGDGNFEGVFGTNLDYAPYVIGDTLQADVHAGRWWQMKDVAARAADRVGKLWNDIAEKLAKFLEGKNG